MSLRTLRKLCGMTVILFILSCAPISASVPTFDPNSINTMIVETANAAATRTAMVASPTHTLTNTPLPSSTPSETPSPTVTFVFILPTATVPSATPEPGSSGKALDCQIVAMDPADGSHIRPRKEFPMIWTVMNMGTDAWDSNNMDYRYKSGVKLHLTEAYDLEVSPAPGEQVELRVAMKAPDTTGTYSTTWVINYGKKEFCRMSITILVP